MKSPLKKSLTGAITTAVTLLLGALGASPATALTDDPPFPPELANAETVPLTQEQEAQYKVLRALEIPAMLYVAIDGTTLSINPRVEFPADGAFGVSAAIAFPRPLPVHPGS